MESEAELLQPVGGLGPPGQRAVHACGGQRVALGRGHGTPVPHRGHGRGQGQLELGKVRAPVPQRPGGHARIVGAGRVSVVFARHAGRPADVHQRCLLVAVLGSRGCARVGAGAPVRGYRGRGGRGGRRAFGFGGGGRGTYFRYLAGHALRRRRVVRSSPAAVRVQVSRGAARGQRVLRVAVPGRRARRAGPLSRLVHAAQVLVLHRQPVRLVLVQTRYAGRLLGQALVHDVLQQFLLLAAAAAVVVTGPGGRAHGQVTGEQVALGLRHAAVHRFHGHVVAALLVAAAAADSSAVFGAAASLLMAALVARVRQSGLGQHVFGVLVMAQRFAEVQVHVVVRRGFTAVGVGGRRGLQVHVIGRVVGPRRRFCVLPLLRNVHRRVNGSALLTTVRLQIYRIKR